MEAIRTPPGPAPAKDMVWVPGGPFLMGSDAFYPEERPARRATVGGFWMDAYPVTNAAFRRFVAATGYVTIAERSMDPVDYPRADPALLVPGALVFRNPGQRVSLHDVRQWWIYTQGACWKQPEGPGSTLAGRERHPVVQVAYADALAYAAWAGKAIPTESEWEFAARGGLDGAAYVWGDEFTPKGRLLANTWQGEFPWQNLQTDGYTGTSPVHVFPANGYGLHDMAGNVWEWTSDHYTQPAAQSALCCTSQHVPIIAPAIGEAGAPSPGIERRVIKGGSYLCAPNYCKRYRPAARQPQDVDTATSHLGFRCIVRP